MNFDRYYKQINRLNYFVGSEQRAFYFSFVKVNGVAITPTFVEDLVVKKLCHHSKPKLDTGTNVCSTVTSCPNASLCANENVPIICNANYVYDSLIASGPSCRLTCSNQYARGAMSTVDKSFCNRKCDNNMTNCEIYNISPATSNYNNNTCLNGFDRYGYKCIAQTTSKKSKENLFSSFNNFIISLILNSMIFYNN